MSIAFHSQTILIWGMLLLTFWLTFILSWWNVIDVKLLFFLNRNSFNCSFDLLELRPMLICCYCHFVLTKPCFCCSLSAWMMINAAASLCLSLLHLFCTILPKMLLQINSIEPHDYVLPLFLCCLCLNHLLQFWSPNWTPKSSCWHF